MPDLPAELFHATSYTIAQGIGGQNGTGLIPMSGKDPQKPYLCMSGVLQGAVTKYSKASDIIFRVLSAKLDKKKWRQEGAGNNEWRGDEGIPVNLLEYRRNLGTDKQTKTWRAATVFPLEM
jgi:hypothetical protein